MATPNGWLDIQGIGTRWRPCEFSHNFWELPEGEVVTKVMSIWVGSKAHQGCKDHCSIVEEANNSAFGIRQCKLQIVLSHHIHVSTHRLSGLLFHHWCTLDVAGFSSSRGLDDGHYLTRKLAKFKECCFRILVESWAFRFRFLSSAVLETRLQKWQKLIRFSLECAWLKDIC